MRLFGYEFTGLAKAAVLLMATLLVAIGLCSGTGTVEANHGWAYIGPHRIPNTFLGNTVAILDVIGAGAILISLLSLCLILIGWSLALLHRQIFGTQRDHIQKLLDETPRKNSRNGEDR